MAIARAGLKERLGCVGGIPARERFRPLIHPLELVRAGHRVLQISPLLWFPVVRGDKSDLSAKRQGKCDLVA